MKDFNNIQKVQKNEIKDNRMQYDGRLLPRFTQRKKIQHTRNEINIRMNQKEIDFVNN